jgi:hypothetical protein
MILVAAGTPYRQDPEGADGNQDHRSQQFRQVLVDDHDLLLSR